MIMDWTRGNPIGRGSTATVSVATTRGSADTFAVKSIELSESKILQREQKIISAFDHPHIVSYKGCDITMEHNMLMFNLKMEYLQGGTLSDAIKRAGGRLEESMISCYARQILEGLEYLHSSGVVHCDIKSQNILLGQSGAKIVDFGCAKWLTPVSSLSVSMAGTPLFMAPEVARGEDQGCPADIWALGCTILEMATGYSPWPNATNAASLLYRIAFSGDLPEIPQFLSDQAKDFLSKCLRRGPKDRWTAKQLLKHKFLEEFRGDSEVENQELCTTASPTSILDQDIWNSVKETEAHKCCMIPENSDHLRARRLGLLSVKSGNPNWTWEKDWITIRASEEDEES